MTSPTSQELRSNAPRLKRALGCIHTKFEKYKKLPVYNEQKYPHIARCISNERLYNEDCLLTRQDRVVITEGVTNAIALMERGFTVILPVTVRIKETDWKRLLPRLRNVETVYLCQDNDISEAGLNGALRPPPCFPNMASATSWRRSRCTRSAGTPGRT